MRRVFFLLFTVAFGCASFAFILREWARTSAYVLAGIAPKGATVETRISVPPRFERVPVPVGSFGSFLRTLPLKPDGSPVRLHTGALKTRQDVHVAVVDRDPGPKDLQQCADAVIRLRAEYLCGAGRADEVSFHFACGFPCEFRRWAAGERVRVTGNTAEWVAGGVPAPTEEALRSYLDLVYTYAGTASLPSDLVRCEAGSRVEVGDVFLHVGPPGHAMLVVDVAANGAERAFLLAQSYRPAQDIHVVRNPASIGGAPWFVAGSGSRLVTPEWSFAWGERWRFPAR